MKVSRRQFLGATAAAGAFSLLPARSALAASNRIADEALEKAAARPVVDFKNLKDPVIIESIELLRKGKTHFVRICSTDGAEGISVDDGRMGYLHSILNELVIPYFIGKDARDLEEHLFQVYRWQSNYKLLGLALWVPVAIVEFAILDLILPSKPCEVFVSMGFRAGKCNEHLPA